MAISKDAGPFWARYKKLAPKDLPVILKAEIKQPTLSAWRARKLFPRADEAQRIAAAIGTTVEYLVTGNDTHHSPCSPAAFEIAIIADNLSEEGRTLLHAVAAAFEKQYPPAKKKK